MIILCATISSFFYLALAAHKHLLHERDLEATKAGKGQQSIAWLWEVFFLLDFVLKFLVDYYEKSATGLNIIQRDLKKIAKNYYATEFWSDLIPLVPW